MVAADRRAARVSGATARWTLAAIALAAIALVAGFLIARAAIWYQTADFFCFWNGARLLLSGRDPYDALAWQSATGGYFPDPRGGVYISACAVRFAYPLWTAIALAPFGAMPLEIAATTWIALAIVASVLGTALAWRAVRGEPGGLPLFVALVLFSQPFWLLLAGGQMSGVMLALAGASALWLAERRDVPAGVSLAALALKPQVAALVVPLVLLRGVAQRRWPLLGAALATGAIGLAISFALAPWWPREWAAEVARRSQGVALFPTVWGLATDLFGTPLLGAPLLALLLIAVAVVARRTVFKELPFFGFAVAFSLIVTPHLFSYDFLVLAVPWAIIFGELRHMSGLRRSAFLVGLVCVASLLPWLLYALAFTRGRETWSAIVPAATALLLAAALAERRRHFSPIRR